MALKIYDGSPPSTAPHGRSSYCLTCPTAVVTSLQSSSKVLRAEKCRWQNLSVKLSQKQCNNCNSNISCTATCGAALSRSLTTCYLRVVGLTTVVLTVAARCRVIVRFLRKLQCMRRAAASEHMSWHASDPFVICFVLLPLHVVLSVPRAVSSGF